VARAIWRRAAAVLWLAGWAASCVPAKPPTVSLRVRGEVADADVTIDDEYVGELSYVKARGVALPVGTHRVSVERSGYFPWDRLVTAREGDPPIVLQVELTPIPD
jgi:hypothetical protein